LSNYINDFACARTSGVAPVARPHVITKIVNRWSPHFLLLFCTVCPWAVGCQTLLLYHFIHSYAWCSLARSLHLHTRLHVAGHAPLRLAESCYRTCSYVVVATLPRALLLLLLPRPLAGLSIAGMVCIFLLPRPLRFPRTRGSLCLQETVPTSYDLLTLVTWSICWNIRLNQMEHLEHHKHTEKLRILQHQNINTTTPKTIQCNIKKNMYCNNKKYVLQHQKLYIATSQKYATTKILYWNIKNYVLQHHKNM
jgi:hypothetical protein